MGAVLQQDKKFILHLLAGSDTATALDAAKKLLDAGKHTVNERESAEQLTALHVAAAWGNLAMCQLFIHYGADVNALDAQGRKPADLATENCRKIFAKMDKPEEKRRLLKFLAYIFNRRLIEKVTRRRGRISYPMKDTPRPTAEQMLSETLPCGPGPADDLSPAVLEALALLNVADKHDGWVHVSIPSREANSVRMLYPRLSIPDSNVPTPSAPPEALVVYDELSRPVLSRSSSLLPPIPEPFVHAAPPPPPPRLPFLKPLHVKSHSTSDLPARRPLPVPDPFVEPLPSSPSTNEKEEQLRAKIAKFNIGTLRNRLKAHNCDVGPINELNRSLYERKLAAIEVYEEKENANEKYSSSLERMIRCDESYTKTDMGASEERQLRLAFAVSDAQKDVSFFCYLLIDPTRIPDDVGTCTFRQFVAAVFYVGKGKRSRPLQHLVDASKSRTTSDKQTNEISEKLKRIISLWDGGRGVISLHICFNIHSDEALIREGGMIEAIGVKNLTNLKHGEFRDCAKSWTRNQITDFGSLCLKKAFAVFQNERCRPIFEADLH